MLSSNIKLPIMKKGGVCYMGLWRLSITLCTLSMIVLEWVIQKGENPERREFQMEIVVGLGFIRILPQKSRCVKTFSSAQNVAFVSQSKSSTNKVKSGFTGAYSTCTPSTSSTNIPEKEALAGFADEGMYKQRGQLDEKNEERLFLSTPRSWKAREESDGLADNG
ncbi:hypothetical protein Tco_0168783 [Tanacetum coccineum]